jgi:hypothetical protein
MNASAIFEEPITEPPRIDRGAFNEVRNLLGGRHTIDTTKGIMALSSQRHCGIALKDIDLECLTEGDHTFLLTFRNGEIGKLSVTVPQILIPGDNPRCALKMARDSTSTIVSTTHSLLATNRNSCIPDIAEIIYLAPVARCSATTTSSSNILTQYGHQRREGAELRAQSKGIDTSAYLTTTVFEYGQIDYFSQGATVPIKTHLGNGDYIVITTRSGTTYNVGLRKDAHGTYATLTALTEGKKSREKMISDSASIRDIVIGQRFGFAGAETSAVQSCMVTQRSRKLTELYLKQRESVWLSRIQENDVVIISTESGNKYFLAGGKDSIAVTSTRKMVKEHPPETYQRRDLPVAVIGERLELGGISSSPITEIRYCHQSGKVSPDDAHLIVDGTSETVRVTIPHF